MKKTVIMALALSATLFACKSSQKTAKSKNEVKLNNEIDSISYALAVDFFTGVKGNLFDSLNLDAFMLGARQVYANQPTAMERDAAGKYIQSVSAEYQQKAQEKYIMKNEQFLEENKKKEGVITTESGLQYKVIKTGTGESPKVSDQVTVHYTGRLIDGSMFDSSVERGEPATFPVGGVIQGWVEALQLMNTGAKFELYIPSNLGYGSRGAGNVIPPNSTLIFEVELLKIN